VPLIAKLSKLIEAADEVCCSVLQYVAVYCSVLQYFAVFLQCVAVLMINQLLQLMDAAGEVSLCGVYTHVHVKGTKKERERERGREST